jgi:hypothetical protein
MLMRKVGTCHYAFFFSIPSKFFKKKWKAKFRFVYSTRLITITRILVINTASQSGSYSQRQHNKQKSNPPEQQMIFGTRYTCNAITNVSNKISGVDRDK